MIAQQFEQSFDNWESKINEDEWYFDKIREKLLGDISPADAYQNLLEIPKLILKLQNDFLVSESLQLFIDLARKANTTELPTALKDKWPALQKHINQFKEYERTQLRELEKWYRIKAL